MTKTTGRSGIGGTDLLGQRNEVSPCAAVDLDTCLAALGAQPLPQLAREKDLVESFRVRGVLQVGDEIGHHLLEPRAILQAFDVEDGEEDSVVVPSLRVDAETETGEQPTEHLHHE